MGFIDLHTHSTYSDGTLTPSEIVKLAENLKLKAVALTDHDTVSGLKEFLQSETEKVEKIPGVEISVQMRDFNFHMVGLFIDINRGIIQEKLDILQKERANRNYKIIAKLNEHGYKITIDELMEIAGEQLGRPHIAQVLYKKGYFSSPKEAFEKCLKKGAIAYFDKFRYSPEEAIKMIHESNGIAIFAHPGLLNIKKNEKIELINYLKDRGLDGIEVFYSDHTEDDEKFFLEIANRENLLISGGSDFHGDNKKDIKLGSGRDNLKIEYKFLEKMKKYLEVKNECA